MKTQWRCFEKGNFELPVSQSHPLLCLHPEKMRIKKSHAGGFPGDIVVENLPANAGDMGSGPGLGRSHMPWNN